MEKKGGRYWSNSSSSRGRGYGRPSVHTSTNTRSMNAEQANINDDRDINLRSLREQLPSISKTHFGSSPNSVLERNSTASAHSNPGGSQRPFSKEDIRKNENKYGGRGYRRPNQPREKTYGTSLTRHGNPNPVSGREVREEEDELPFFSGTCTDMCPAKERAQRERLRDLAIFERLNGNPQKTSPSIAVKKFCRTISISETQQSDIRTLPVLWDTWKYLLTLVDTSEHPFGLVHDFVFDRTRAIRQELGMQNIINHQAIIMHEQMVRFHILSQHELCQCGSSSSNSSMLHLNLEQLSKSLKSLLDLYNVNRKGLSASEMDYEAEFNCYHVLLNLGSHSQSQGEPLSVWFWGVRESLLKSKEMKFARNVLRCYRMGNFKGFFNLVRESTYLEACLMECYFDEVRAKSLSCINQGGYKMNPFPLADLAEILMMEEPDMENFCTLCGLLTSTDDRGVKFLVVKQVNFSLPQKGFSQYNCPLISRKRASSYSLEITRR